MKKAISRTLGAVERERERERVVLIEESAASTLFVIYERDG